MDLTRGTVGQVARQTAAWRVMTTIRAPQICNLHQPPKPTHMGVLWQAVQWTDSAAHRRSTATLEAAQAAHTPRACFNHHHLTCAAWLCSLGRRRRRQPARSPATPIGRALAPPTSFIFASLDGGWHGHGHEAWDGLDGLNAWMDWGGSGGRSDATPQTPRPLHSTSTLKHPLGSSWVLLGPLGSS